MWIELLIYLAATFLLFIPALMFWALVLWLLFGHGNIKIEDNELQKRMADLESDREYYMEKKDANNLS